MFSEPATRWTRRTCWIRRFNDDDKTATARVNHARVSTRDQHPENQSRNVPARAGAGTHREYVDKGIPGRRTSGLGSTPLWR